MENENLVEIIEALVDELDLITQRKAALETQISGIRKAVAIPVLGGNVAKPPRKPRSDIGKPRKPYVVAEEDIPPEFRKPAYAEPVPAEEFVGQAEAAE